MDSQENKQMDHQTNQPRVLTQGTNDQAEIILLQTHDAKTQLSGEGSNAGKGGKKEKKRITNSKVDGLSFNCDECTIGRLERPG